MIILTIVDKVSHFRCSLIFCQFNIKNAGKNRPNVQDKENSPAQHVVKSYRAAPRRVYVQRS